jgi:uncharacterized coiled-coil DUF342 family protein
MLRQQHKQQQRKAAEEAAEMWHKENQLAVYCFTYDERVTKLAQLSPKFHTELTKSMQAYDKASLTALN